MERPYRGRATLNDRVGELEIIIPARKSWFTIIFLGAWLCGWCFGELFALGIVTTSLGGPNPPQLFLTFWLIAWTVGGFFALRTFVWLLIGREVITIGHGLLAVKYRGALFAKNKAYDINEIRKMRVQEDMPANGWNRNSRNQFLTISGGNIRFDYGMQTVKIAGGIDEAEANFILEQIQEKELMPPASFDMQPHVHLPV